MSNRSAIRIAALVGFLAVALGAFGAHGLKKVLEANATTEIYHTAVLYHMVHAVVLLVVACRTPVRRCPFIAFLIGIVIFSGSLYTLAISNLRWLGAVTPFGGVALLVGWAWLFISPEPKQ